MRKNILITGHLGYVGATLIRYLHEYRNYCNVIGFDNRYFVDDNILGTPENLLNEEYLGDIRTMDYSILEDEKIDTIIYLSAISNDPMSNKFGKVTEDINCDAALELARVSKNYGVKNFIFASSCSVYGFAENGEVTEESEVNPLTPYAESKLNGERGLISLTNKDFQVTCLRFATACGISDRLRLDLVLNDFVASALMNKKIEILSDGTPWRPLINTWDMARAIDWAIHRDGNWFEKVNVGCNEWNFQVFELAEFVKQQLPETEIYINKDAAPDKRSYKVNFDKFKRLAPDHQPIHTIESTIKALIEGLSKVGFRDKNFRKGNLIRLNKINKLQSQKLINEELKWNK